MTRRRKGRRDDEAMKARGQRGENGIMALFMGTSSTVPRLREMIY